MMSSTKSLRFLAASLAVAAVLLAACSPSAEKLNQDGNQSFSEQSFDEAQFAYQAASEESPDLAEPYYNLANVLYRKGGFDQAIQQIQQAVALTTDQYLAQNGLYNLGNNTYSLQDWATAVEAYRQALLLNPDDQDAKYNLELALQQMQQQQQEQQDREQKQDSQSEDQQGQDQDSQSEDQQDQGSQGDQNQDQQGSENPQDQQEGDSGQDQADQNQQDQGEGQPGEDQGQNQPWGTPQPGEKMTEEQARQLLAALLQNSQTLQEKLGQILVVRGLPPLEDW